MAKGWRIVFYALIGIAVGSITFITVKYILTERLVKDCGDPDPAIRRKAALKVMQPFHLPFLKRDEDKPIEFLVTKPQTVRDNVVWSLEALIAEGAPKSDEAIGWLVEIARDLSGVLPTGDAEHDAARLAVMRLGETAVEPLIVTLDETTQRTLEKDKYAGRRAVAARLLGVLGDSRAVEPLIAALRDEYAGVRQQAAAALARLGTPEAEEALAGYLEPLLGILEGRYRCWVRADSEGRVRRDANRDDLLYGPFDVVVKPHHEATEDDLQRQRDSAEQILKAEEARQAETRETLQAAKQGRVIRPNKRDTPNLGITRVAISRATLTEARYEVVDPAGSPQVFDVVEGEPFTVTVDVKNTGPGDIVNDFFVTLYCAAPRPRNNIDRPEDGPFEGEPARDRRALAGTAEDRHVRTLYGVDREDMPGDQTVAQLVINKQFNTVEADRVEALGQLMYVGHASCVPALGLALEDPSYTVREQAALALQVILQARRTSPPAKAQIAGILVNQGLVSEDPVVRYHAVDALSQDETPEVEARLNALLGSDTDSTVRLAATRALTNKARPDPAEVRRMLAGGDPTARLMAPRLLRNAADAEIARQLLFGGEASVSIEVLRSASRLLTTADLVAGLQLTDARARATAARTLAARRDPAAQTALLAALDDPDGKVRTAAAVGLGALLEEGGEAPTEVVAALTKVIANEAGDYVGVPTGEQPEDPATAATTDKQARAAATAALVQLPNLGTIADAKAAVLEAFKDTHPDVVAAVLPAVARGDLGDQSERLIAIVEDVKMPARVRQSAILAMWESQTKDEESLDALVGLLNDPNEAIKTSAAVALIGLGDNRGNKVLRDQVSNIKVPDIRREAAKLMATLPTESVDRIRGLKDEDRDGYTILLEDLYRTGSLAVNFRFLCNAMAFLDEHRDGTADEVARLAEDLHPVVRGAAVTVLAKIGDERAEALTEAMLSDANEFARAAAVDAVATLGLSRLRSKLYDMVMVNPDPSAKVRGRAVVVITRLDTGVK